MLQLRWTQRLLLRGGRKALKEDVAASGSGKTLQLGRVELNHAARKKLELKTARRRERNREKEEEMI